MSGTIFALSSVLSLQTTAAPVCAKGHEQLALNTSVLRAELMVAALSCGIQPQYNAFVTKFEGALTEHGYLLRAFFQRQYGHSAEQRLNRFVTRLANDESRRSAEVGRAPYCKASSQLLQQLMSDGPHGFRKVLNNPTLSVRHGISACEVTSRVDRRLHEESAALE
ncbi:MAG: hypothetical protein WD928_08550 [Gammaproteobacteria bacterium]